MTFVNDVFLRFRRMEHEISVTFFDAHFCVQSNDDVL